MWRAVGRTGEVSGAWEAWARWGGVECAVGLCVGCGGVCRALLAWLSEHGRWRHAMAGWEGGCRSGVFVEAFWRLGWCWVLCGAAAGSDIGDAGATAVAEALKTNSTLSSLNLRGECVVCGLAMR